MGSPDIKGSGVYYVGYYSIEIAATSFLFYFFYPTWIQMLIHDNAQKECS